MVRDELVGDEAVSCKVTCITSGTFYQDRDIMPHSKLVELEFLGWAQVHMFLKKNSIGSYIYVPR